MKYIAFVLADKGLANECDQLQAQIYLGSDTLVEKMQILNDRQPNVAEIPRAPRRVLKWVPPTLPKCKSRFA